MSRSQLLADVLHALKGVELIARSVLGHDAQSVVDRSTAKLRRNVQRSLIEGAAPSTTSKSDLLAQLRDVFERTEAVVNSAATMAQLMAKEGHMPGQFGIAAPPRLLRRTSEEGLSRVAHEITPLTANIDTPPPPLASLGDKSRESVVPSSRFGRVLSFANLAIGLTSGAAVETLKNTVTRVDASNSATPSSSSFVNESSAFLSDANVERVVATLCRVRGAALKLGQMFSMQDDAMMSPRLQTIMQRVRDSADFMPQRQVDECMRAELGEGWEELYGSFDQKPFAAASIGQVHRATLLDGTAVAVKVQYPGVAASITSDIDNLMTVLKLTNLIPAGLYLDQFAKAARVELSLECDYVREAECMDRMRSLLHDDPVFWVPNVFSTLTTGRVLTSELLPGESLDGCMTMGQEVRDWVGGHLLRLTLNELFKFRFMQTDPNWSNFMLIADDGTGTPRIGLLDFGAARDYDKSFVDDYLRLLLAAIDEDREGVLDWSRKIGFLTGFEKKEMNDAHVEAVLILGEALRSREPFDFGKHDISRRIVRLLPTMVERRQTAPPKETYSLHRKMSGAFLLNGKLRSRVRCRPMIDHIVDGYEYGHEGDNRDSMHNTQS